MCETNHNNSFAMTAVGPAQSRPSQPNTPVMLKLDSLFPRRNARHAVRIDQAEWLDLRGKLAAINRSQAVIEFSLEGVVLQANDNFLRTMGYTLEQIRGRHHR